MDKLIDQIRTTHNATQSPLLRLPAELRNMIYLEVLREPKHSFCWPPLARVRKAALACNKWWMLWFVCLRICTLRIPEEGSDYMRTPMPGSHDRACPIRDAKHCHALLYVCRQIHTEAALLPYTLYFFSFNKLKAFKHFVSSAASTDRFGLTLRQAIGTMELRIDCIDDPTSGEFGELAIYVEGMRHRQTSILDLLPNLQKVVFVAWSASGSTLDEVPADGVGETRWTKVRRWLRGGDDSSESKVVFQLRHVD